MASKIPTKIVSGKTKRMATGDTVPVGNGGTNLSTVAANTLLGAETLDTVEAVALGTGFTLSSATLTYTESGPAVSLTNDNGGTCAPGMAVYLKSNGHFDLAKADSATTSTVYGIAMLSILTTASGNIRPEGRVTLTTGQWDTVAGTTGGLAPGTAYWLDPTTAGHITATAPDTTGQEITYLGVAESATVLKVAIQPPMTA